MKNRMNINGMDYVLAGDYYIPVLELPVEECSIGKYGRMHQEYLKEHNPMLYSDLILTCKLWTYLADLNEQAQERLDTITAQMMAVEGVTEGLKRTSQVDWVRAVNSIRNRAEEIILHEMIYV